MPKVPEEECILCGENHKGSCESIKIKVQQRKTSPISGGVSVSPKLDSKPFSIPDRKVVAPKPVIKPAFIAPTRKDPDVTLMKACDALYELIHIDSILEHQTFFSAVQVRAAQWKRRQR